MKNIQLLQVQKNELVKNVNQKTKYSKFNHFFSKKFQHIHSSSFTNNHGKFLQWKKN